MKNEEGAPNLKKQLENPNGEGLKVEKGRPSVSEDVGDEIKGYDEAIEEYSQDNKMLAEIAVDKIFHFDEDAVKELYQKEKFRMGIDIRDDSGNLEQASGWLKFKNSLSRFITLGIKGAKDVEVVGGNLKDKTKISKYAAEADGSGERILGEEKKRAMEDSGLSEEEAKDLNYEKKYTREGGHGKIIERDRTRNEVLASAKALLEQRVKELEVEGNDLVVNKTSLFNHQKDKDGAIEMISDVERRKEFEDEMKEQELDQKILIDNKESKLQDKLDVIRGPLVEAQEETGNIVEKMSSVFKEVSDKEKEFNDKVREITSNIGKAGRLKLLDGMQDKITEELNKELTQAKVNQEAFKKKKLEIKARLDGLKINKKEIDDKLKEINKIGKTKEELAKEREVSEAKIVKSEGNVEEGDKSKQEGYTTENKEEEKITILNISKSLGIGGDKNEREVFINCFKKGKKINKNETLSIEEAKTAYIKFLTERAKKKLSEADTKEAQEKINSIFNVVGDESPDEEVQEEDNNGEELGGVSDLKVIKTDKERVEQKPKDTSSKKDVKSEQMQEVIPGGEKVEDVKEKEGGQRIKIEYLFKILSDIDHTLRGRAGRSKFLKEQKLSINDSMTVDSAVIEYARLYKIKKSSNQKQANMMAKSRFYDSEGNIKGDINNLLT